MKATQGYESWCKNFCPPSMMNSARLYLSRHRFISAHLGLAWYDDLTLYSVKIVTMRVQASAYLPYCKVTLHNIARFCGTRFRV